MDQVDQIHQLLVVAILALEVHLEIPMAMFMSMFMSMEEVMSMEEAMGNTI